MIFLSQRHSAGLHEEKIIPHNNWGCVIGLRKIGPLSLRVRQLSMCACTVKNTLKLKLKPLRWMVFLNRNQTLRKPVVLLLLHPPDSSVKTTFGGRRLTFRTVQPLAVFLSVQYGHRRFSFRYSRRPHTVLYLHIYTKCYGVSPHTFCKSVDIRYRSRRMHGQWAS